MSTEKNAAIGVYETHKDAIKAIKYLKKEGFDEDNLSIVGKGAVVEDNLHIHNGKEAMEVTSSAGAVIGGVLGVLAGTGVMAVPGIGFLFLGGALLGGVGGATLGLATGGLAGLFAAIGIGRDGIATYEQHLSMGKFLVIIQGPKDKVTKANELLGQHNEHLQLAEY